MLTSETFARSERLSAFLRFTITETLAGRGDGLKEQVIASQLYRKGEGFDSTSDATVRIDARRLRDRLREYYAEHHNDPVIISLPKGSYRPAFETNATAQSPALVTVPILAPIPAPVKQRWAVMTAAVAVLGIGLLLWEWRADKPIAWEPQPLAALPGIEGPPSLSPDGNLVAFPWNGGAESGAFDIWVKAVGSEALRRLTETPDSEISPAWSPDGREIAFIRSGAGVFVVSQLGGPERRISESGTYVAWAPDGKSVLIRDHVDDKPAGIYQIFVESLQRRQITQPQSGAGDWRFELSPDGKTLAFIRSQREGASDIYTSPMPGGEPQRRTDLGAQMGGLAWSPDGREIVFSYSFSSVPRLSRIAAVGSRPSRGSPVHLPVNAHFPAISRPPRGQPARLAFVALYIDHSLCLIDLNNPVESGAIQRFTPLFDSSRPDYPGSGSFSPDGSRIAFTSDRSGSNQLWTGNRDGSGLRQLTALESPGVQSPSWSPDGRQIVFEASIRGNTDLYVIDQSGGALKRLTQEPSTDAQPFWSRNGRWVYFMSDRSGQRQVWKQPAEGGPAVQVTKHGGSEPVEAVDGDFLYYYHRSGNGPGLLKKVRVDGRDESVLLPSVRPHSWALSAKGIFFLSITGGRDALEFYSFESGKATRVGQLPFRIAWNGDIGRLAVSRDGRWALATRHDRFDADLMLVDNFR